MHIFVIGGGGYVGSELVPTLIKEGHKVTVYDLFLYGDTLFDSLQNHDSFKQIKGDVRNFELLKKSLKDTDAVIHLACISNDPSFELNPKLGKSINLDSFEPVVKLCKEKGVKRFIYASSSSVYGIKKEKDVTEDMSLEPLTDYSRFKAECEKILFKHKDENFICTVLRPATVCGYAPRQRLDVIVNILTNHAYHNGKIKIFGGEQMRPNIHVKDMARAYIHVLNSPTNTVQGEIFNIGFHNFTVSQLANIVQKIVGKKKDVDLEVIPTDDLRSYHVSSKKIGEKLNFYPQYTIEDAVEDLMNSFEKQLLPNSLEDAKYFNIKTMKALDLQ